MTGRDANRIFITNSSGNISISSNVTTTELSYLNGVTSNIQPQINKLIRSSLTYTKYTNKISLSSSSWFQINNSQLFHFSNGLVYWRISGETLQAIPADKVIILGYVNSSYVNANTYPVTVATGTTADSTGYGNAVFYGTETTTGFERQVRLRVTSTINLGYHVWATCIYMMS